MAMYEPVKEATVPLRAGRVIMHRVRGDPLPLYPMSIVITSTDGGRHFVVAVVGVMGDIGRSTMMEAGRGVVVIVIRRRNSLDPDNLFAGLELWYRALVVFWDRGCDLVDVGPFLI